MATFSGGEKLEAYLKKLADKVRNPGTLRVGFLENATYPNGMPVATVAALQNFGAPQAGIPARDFFSKMIRDHKSDWGKKLANILERVDWDGEQALELMGAGMAGQLRQQIVETMGPPLSPVTLMLRKMRDENPDLEVTGATVVEARQRVANGESGASGTRARPLVDTGHLLQSVDSEVAS